MLPGQPRDIALISHLRGWYRSDSITRQKPAKNVQDLAFAVLGGSAGQDDRLGLTQFGCVPDCDGPGDLLQERDLLFSILVAAEDAREQQAQFREAKPELPHNIRFPVALDHVSAAVLPMMWLEAGYAVRRKPDKPRDAINARRPFGEELQLGAFGLHFVDHTVDACLRQPDGLVITICRSVVAVYCHSQLGPADLAPVGLVVAPELSVTEDHCRVAGFDIIQHSLSDFDVRATRERKRFRIRSGRPRLSRFGELEDNCFAHCPLARSLKSKPAGGLTMRTVRPSACQRDAADSAASKPTSSASAAISTSRTSAGSTRLVMPPADSAAQVGRPVACM